MEMLFIRKPIDRWQEIKGRRDDRRHRGSFFFKERLTGLWGESKKKKAIFIIAKKN